MFDAKPGLAERLLGLTDIVLAQVEVDVVVRLGTAAREGGVAAGQRERHAALLERNSDAFHRVAHLLRVFSRHARIATPEVDGLIHGRRTTPAGAPPPLHA